jgi:hypothetical protein
MHRRRRRLGAPVKPEALAGVLAELEETVRHLGVTDIVAQDFAALKGCSRRSLKRPGTVRTRELDPINNITRRLVANPIPALQHDLGESK